MAEMEQEVTMAEKNSAIRECREEAGYTAQEAATKLGCAISTLLNYEHGKTYPTAVRIHDMAQLYGCSVDRLLGTA
jgi:transcriptional regulator with XRE-family HTH domain